MVESQIEHVGRDLARTFAGVLGALPGAPHRPQWLARLLGVNVVLTSRILKAAQQDDPMAVAHLIPGPEPLRRLLKAAEKKKIDPALVQEAQDAVDRFERLIDEVAGDRSALDAMISGWLPDAREKVELIAKQSVFRGMSQILGIGCDAEHYTVILYPSQLQPGRADQLWLVSARGLRRTRPGPLVKYEAHYSTTPMQTISGEPVKGAEGILLEQFCSTPTPKLDATYFGDRAEFTMGIEGVGLQFALNLAYAIVAVGRKEIHRDRGQPPRRMTVSVGIQLPAKCFIFDLLLHDDLFPGQQPTLHLYRTGVRGVANPDDPTFDMDRLDVIESIQPLGRGIAQFRASENPEHLDMLRHVCSERQWDGRKLRGFRCRIEYPIYNSQVMLGLELPERRD